MKKLCKMAFVCICVLFCELVLLIPTHAKGVSVQIEPRMTSISFYSTELSISSDGIASVTGFVRGKSGVTSTYVKVTLQQNVSGNWVDVKSWEDSNSTRSTSVDETYLVSRGTYRVTMTCSADGESKTVTSAERTY